jgi:DNA-binding CsgD family transcriptional regulator
MAGRGTRVGRGLPQQDEESFSRERPLLRDHVEGLVAQRVGQFGQRHRLSLREEQIFLRLVLGSHPKAIGASLGCEYGTVRTHIRRMQKKLGCTGMRELLVRFISEL